MSINTDGPKRSGKFLKRGSKLLKSVHMTQYSFHNIDQPHNIEFDNSERSIIHAKFHDPAEIARSVKESDKLKENLYDPARPPMAIIMPGDFTEDWMNERMNSKRRALGFEDEDDFDDPYGTAARAAAENKRRQASTIMPTPKDSETKAEPQIAVQPTNLRSVMAPENSGVMAAEDLVTAARPVSIVKDPYSNHNARETEVVSHGGQASQHVSDAAPENEEFIPLSAGNPLEPRNAEDQAIATYKQRAEIEAANADVLEELRNAAKSEGYNDGFRNGEEKGVMAGQKNAGEIFHRVTELLKEFEGLKRNVLENIQKNFFELSQAVAEALLEREFSVKPEAFAKVLEKVLKDTVSDDQFKIRLHPETWQRVTDLKVPSLEGHLTKDPSIPVGEFKVESNLTVVDGNVKKIVAQMLQNVDMNLFEETKVAS